MSIQQKQCAIKGCTSNFDHLRKGYCQKHYDSLKKYGDPMFITNRRNNRPKRCKVEGCNKPGYTDKKGGRTRYPNGYCQTHYLRLNRYNRIDRQRRILGGKQSHPLSSIWYGMLDRCYNENHISYRNYGKRGIKVCERWLDFNNFVLDMGERPDGMTLDRIDYNGNYEPSNCRWATIKQQANNTRANNRLTIDGVTKTITEWSKYSDVSPSQIGRRIKSGWSHYDAVFKPRLRKLKT